MSKAQEQATPRLKIVRASELTGGKPLPLNENPTDLTLDEIIKFEPRIGEILHEVKPALRIDRRYQQYSDTKRQLSQLVGWSAERFELRSSKAYDVVIDGVMRKLRIL